MIDQIDAITKSIDDIWAGAKGSEYAVRQLENLLSTVVRTSMATSFVLLDETSAMKLHERDRDNGQKKRKLGPEQAELIGRILAGRPNPCGTMIGPSRLRTLGKKSGSCPTLEIWQHITR